HVSPANQVILTWCRRKDEDGVKHEVRYAFADIHRIGWAKATPAPGGIVAPPRRNRSANGIWASGMVYDSTGLPLSGQSMLYLAIKPENSVQFTQIAVPLHLK